MNRPTQQYKMHRVKLRLRKYWKMSDEMMNAILRQKYRIEGYPDREKIINVMRINHPYLFGTIIK